MRIGENEIKVIPTWDGGRREPGSEPGGSGEGGYYDQAVVYDCSGVPEVEWKSQSCAGFCFVFTWSCFEITPALHSSRIEW